MSYGLRWTEQQLAQLKGARATLTGQGQVKRSKYGNTRVAFQGQVFDSKQELKQYQWFEQQRLLGAIRAVVRQVSLPLPQSRLDAANVSSQELLSGDSGSNTADMLAGFCAEARKYLATSRQHVANLPRNMRVAFLPLALVETYLRALERPGRDVLRTPAEIAPLTRVCRIAAAHWLGRI